MSNPELAHIEDAELRSMAAKDAQAEKRKSTYMWVLVALILLSFLAMLWITAENNGKLETLQNEADRSDTAAVEVAQERQDQARTIKELCESGAIEQDARGKSVCDEAAQVAKEDPEKRVQALKGERGPQGPQGLTGAQGEPGTPGSDGKPGQAGAPGKDGRPGTDGLPGKDGVNGKDSTVSGPAGPAGKDGLNGNNGVDGKNGADSTVPGPQGAKGDTGATGTKGDSGPAGPPGPPGINGADGKDGIDGKDGRGISDIQCTVEGRWIVTWSDGATSDAGICRIIEAPLPTDPAPTPTDTGATP